MINFYAIEGFGKLCVFIIILTFWVWINPTIKERERKIFVFCMILFFVGVAIFFGINELMTAEDMNANT